MNHDVLLPRTGSTSSDQATIVTWHVAVGATVAVGDVVAEVETDKSVVDVESTATGTVTELCATEEQELTIGDVLLRIDDGTPTKTGAKASPAVPALREGPECLEPAPERGAGFAPRSRAGSPPLRATPAARRRSRELGVDIAALTPGSGPEGRVEVPDVESAATVAPTATPAWAAGLTGVRRTVALRMAESAALVAPVTLQRDVDVTDLTAWAARRPPGAPGGVLDALLVLVTRALVRHPDVNAHLLPTGIVEHDAVHLGYAVDGARGLVVPVVRDATDLTLDALAERRRALVAAARTVGLSSADQDGATFTVTNLGPLGVDHFSPIVNLPQVAILGLGAFRRVLDVGDDDTPVVRRKLGVSLTFDHRAVDGAPAARFLDRLARTAADPFELLA